MIPENEDKIRFAWKDNKIKGLESAYLSASDKVLRLGVENERIKASKEALLEACREALKALEAGPDYDAGVYQLLTRAIANAEGR